MPENKSAKKTFTAPSPLREGVHFYSNEQGLMVFTEAYHLERGYCCKSGCKHCPYGFKKDE
ncbi:MAG: hypothetical protein GC180_12820 [Bacteroidetes bacterium]|nr:hypothetical protein [Bacteroidota bacterium]